VSITEKDGAFLFDGSAEVRLELLPRPRVYVHATNVNAANQQKCQLLNTQSTVLTLKGTGNQAEGFLTTVDLIPPLVVWVPRSEPMIGVGDDNTEICKVIFHLFNFKSIVGTRYSLEQRGNISRRIERVNISTNSWNLELQSLFETDEYIKRLDAEGGYGLTHIGCLKKPGGSLFTGKEASEALLAIRDFLSFAKGNWCIPVCAVGFDEAGNRAWESWSSPREYWQKPQSWFDPHHCEQLELLFPGFMELWNNENWRRTLHEVIYWYLNANHDSRGIDAGIILTQAAIERLSYEYSVKDRKLIEAKGFKDLRASDKLRLLFSSLKIPIDIPSSLPTMTKLSSRYNCNWLDSPHALTEIRNSLVHPERKLKEYHSNTLFEAWNLGLWYIELALLRICGYRGTYGNRLIQRWVGQIENVPWMQ
jgi:hypothetical protein